MGCDIHAYVEYRNYDKWWHFASLSFDRNYGAFACMANVRNNGDATVFGAKGIPDDLGWTVKDKYCLYVSEDNNDYEHCTKEEADRYVKTGSSVWMGESRVTHPDWHMPSWLGLAEVNQAQANYMAYYRDPVMPDRSLYGEDVDKLMEALEETKGQSTPVDPEPSLSAISAMMDELNKVYDDVCLVFWFDN